MQIQIGDIIRLKKKHPCGSFEWDVLRVGADFRLRCCGCGCEHGFLLIALRAADTSGSATDFLRPHQLQGPVQLKLSS